MVGPNTTLNSTSLSAEDGKHRQAGSSLHMEGMLSSHLDGAHSDAAYDHRYKVVYPLNVVDDLEDMDKKNAKRNKRKAAPCPAPPAAGKRARCSITEEALHTLSSLATSQTSESPAAPPTAAPAPSSQAPPAAVTAKAPAPAPAAPVPKQQRVSPDRERSEKGGRFDNSLGIITRRFADLIAAAREGRVDLNSSALQLSVQKRRIYDITNVLEGIGLVKKQSKNVIQWVGDPLCSPNVRDTVLALKHQNRDLTKEEDSVDAVIRQQEQELKDLVGCNTGYAFVTYDSLVHLPCMADNIILAVRAPEGTTLEVPEGPVGVRKRSSYQMTLKSSSLQPINVMLISRENLAPISLDSIDTGDVQAHSSPTVDQVAVSSPSGLPDMLSASSPGLLLPSEESEADYYLNMLETEGICDFYV
eukprot:CAMPEP_0177650816 /NCGR_PEP_ID=MMETSP0447-20121125/12164_1 /TAXON_ID=0 /ORGANISM="Stygamoeba regulata, Strain BSH-02190019" /LENGTH=415 /DNA_ID=CAMNT_0019153751 /DNA_START=148 /DNA_END=1395 /DNA_ORIENTATION=-